LVDRLSEAYEVSRDRERAVPMAAYMHDRFPFLGIATPQRRRIDRGVLAGLPAPSEAELASTAWECWRRPEREYQYFACDYLARYVGRCSAAFLPAARRFVTTKSWWDTVDVLAQRVVGTLVLEHQTLGREMDRWSAEENIWLVRTAILHQNRFKDRTDAARLFGYCRRHAGNPEFYVRKAIGWALREYSKTDPDAVREYVADRGDELSPLSRREALKWLNRRGT
jgi:3-methyladenine DNA glycosylase AlkD